MKLSTQSSLLISLLLIGLIQGITFCEIIIPLFGNSMVYCVSMGVVFGFINYFLASGIYKKYDSLKRSNKLLQKELKIDKLTGLLNRRAFDADMKELSESEAFSMIFIDIDNFKKVNDQFGHPSGDIILKKVSQAIKSGVRNIDRVYRYGGEEIVILLKDCDKNSALEIAEKLRSSTSGLDNSPLPQITISLGISSYPVDDNNIPNIIKSCDDALLSAKASGKNCTYVCIK